MFDDIRDMAARVEAMNQDDLFEVAMNDPDIQAQIIALNQHQLYDEGVYPDGTPTGDYAPATIHGTANFEGKIAKGQRYDHVTWKDTGSFYDSMKVIAAPDGITISNDGQSSQTISDMDASEAMGLTDESIVEILPPITELLRSEIEGIIFAN